MCIVGPDIPTGEAGGFLVASYHHPPIGSADRWQVIEGYVVRIHFRLRYQFCHPLHSSYPPKIAK